MVWYGYVDGSTTMVWYSIFERPHVKVQLNGGTKLN